MLSGPPVKWRATLPFRSSRDVLRRSAMLRGARLPTAHFVRRQETDVLPPFLGVVRPGPLRREHEKDQKAGATILHLFPPGLSYHKTVVSILPT
jgi:hypothetical protein